MDLNIKLDYFTFYIHIHLQIVTSLGVTRADLSTAYINIQRLTLRSQFCFDKTFIGSQDATIVITYTD